MSQQNWMPEFKVIEQSQSQVELELEFSPGLEMYKGHFPDFSITPGVVQTHFMISMAHKYLGLEMYPLSFPNVKFMSPIVPSKKVHLKLQWIAEKSTLKFSYVSDEITHSKGQVKMQVLDE